MFIILFVLWLIYYHNFHLWVFCFIHSLLLFILLLTSHPFYILPEFVNTFANLGNKWIPHSCPTGLHCATCVWQTSSGVIKRATLRTPCIVFSAIFGKTRKKSRNISFGFFACFCLQFSFSHLRLCFVIVFAVVVAIFQCVIYDDDAIPFSIFDTARHSASYVVAAWLLASRWGRLSAREYSSHWVNC